MSAVDAGAPGLPPKLDPESLVLRGSPARVTRFRRGAIIAIAAAGSVSIAGIAWLALKPANLGLIRPSDEQVELTQKAAPDALAGAPRSYGDVPKLGPPLPGDLGRPILDHQRQLERAGAGEGDAGRDAIDREQAEQERRAAELRSARQSAVLVQLSGSRVASVAPVASDPINASAATSETVPRAAVRDPNGQQHKLDFVERQRDPADVNPHELTNAASPYMLSAGTVIAASLITGLNSDLPGLVTAQVTQNVMDSATGRFLLIPQGSRLIGDYDHVVAYGQKRALVVWQRIVLPDGSSIRIPNMPASDTSGYAGLSDKIDLHSWQLLKGVGLATLLGVGAELSIGGNDDDLVTAVRESTQQNAARTGDQLVSRNLDVQPTLRVRPGWPLRVLVNKDILLRPWVGGDRSR